MNDSRYRLERPLATGGMAELFLGVARGAEGFEKHVAIKRVLPHLASEPTIAKMFLAEARLATHLQHQNIASVYDVGSGPNGLFLVMELVNGWDLGVLLRHAWRVGQRFPPHLVAFIGAQTLAGLIHAYRRTHNGRPVLTAHRDISPSNILISREGEVKVTDFGIARMEGVSMGTQPGTFKGKMPYSSPETLRGEPATALSDQFALGIVLHELLAGKHPFFVGKGTDPMAFALAISQQEAPPLPADVPAPLAAVVKRAMAKDPAARFPRPEDMADALARYLAQAGEPATSQSLSDFIASLNPPPTLLELSEPNEPSPSEPAAMAQTVRRPSLATRAVEPSSFELQHDEGWDAQPGGAALSTSGRLITSTAAAPAPVVRDFRCPRCDSLLPSAHAPCDRCARELSPDLSALDEDVSPELNEPPPSQARPVTPPRAATAPQAPMRSVLDMKEEELQLVERAPRPESDFDPDDYKPRRPLGPVVAKVAMVLLVLGAGVVAWPYLSRQLTSLRYSVGPKPQLGVLSIQSEPEGATVTVDGAVLGTTPLVMDNTFAAGDVPVKVTLKGYKPWTGTFVGGQPQSLEVKLRR